MHHFILMFCSAHQWSFGNILQPYSLAYSELCQTSKMESFPRIAMRNNPLKTSSSCMISGDGASAEVN